MADFNTRLTATERATADLHARLSRLEERCFHTTPTTKPLGNPDPTPQSSPTTERPDDLMLKWPADSKLFRGSAASAAGSDCTGGCDSPGSTLTTTSAATAPPAADPPEVPETFSLNRNAAGAGGAWMMRDPKGGWVQLSDHRDLIRQHEDNAGELRAALSAMTAERDALQARCDRQVATIAGMQYELGLARESRDHWKAKHDAIAERGGAG